ncbi:tryptophan 2,3-dioxygenase [Nocardia sp. NPDC051900]|uniref:tryptophan 2,3-dioxygenase n=1 Tax=Nocardia sp. NPDC051900 TaxID=3364326 RepID=UPI0037A55E12
MTVEVFPVAPRTISEKADSMCTDELRAWLRTPDAMCFPFGQVIDVYHGVGKHFVADDILTLLDEARSALPRVRGPWHLLRTIASFLDIALDKRDGLYEYPTYLALPLLELPSLDDPVQQAPFARARCDRLMAQLVSDILGFELAAMEGQATALSGSPPAPALVLKRFRHGLKVLRPVCARLAVDNGAISGDLLDQARRAHALIRADMSPTEQRALALSMLPVHTLHDEYMFIRVLQSFETTFALLAVDLQVALIALRNRELQQAIRFLSAAAEALTESAPLFSMIATMQVESFHIFRRFTDGASAIQSRNYKFVESLCRRPHTERLNSAAYESVPEVRSRVISGLQSTIDDAYAEAYSRGFRSETDRVELTAAMTKFSRAMHRWRNTHYRVAVRMLGEVRGTGQTEGAAYLAAVREIPIFTSVDTPRGTSISDPPTP